MKTPEEYAGTDLGLAVWPGWEVGLVRKHQTEWEVQVQHPGAQIQIEVWARWAGDVVPNARNRVMQWMTTAKGREAYRAFQHA